MAVARTGMAVSGLTSARKAFKVLDVVAKDAMGDATEETIERMRAIAVQRVPVRYGFLRDRIAAKMSRVTGIGKVGITSGAVTTPEGKQVSPAKYAHHAEFGTQYASAQPFMLPAAEDQRQPYLDRCRKAGKTIERETANVGMKNL